MSEFRGAAQFTIEDTEIRVSEFSDQVVREIQYFYFLNEEAAKKGTGTVGLCLSEVQISLLATQSRQDGGDLDLVLGDIKGDNLFGSLAGSVKNTEIRNYTYHLKPDYSKPSRKDANAFKNVGENQYSFSKALIDLKGGLAASSKRASNPDFGPPFDSTKLTAKFTFKVEKVSESDIVLTVLSSALVQKGVGTLNRDNKYVSDASALVAFEWQPSGGICRNRQKGEVTGPIPDVVYTPYKTYLNPDI